MSTQFNSVGVNTTLNKTKIYWRPVSIKTMTFNCQNRVKAKTNVMDTREQLKTLNNPSPI